jgi:hypothetical protein
MVNTDTSIEEEIKERIAAVNRAYHVHKQLFTSKLISRNVKLQLYNTSIRPTVTYASETWVLNAWPKIIMCRRSTDGNPCLKDQLEDLKHVGKITLWKI